jgi:hypothetical protein
MAVRLSALSAGRTGNFLVFISVQGYIAAGRIRPIENRTKKHMASNIIIFSSTERERERLALSIGVN